MKVWWHLAASLFAAIVLTAGGAAAHCDGMDGPVVTAARKALETGNVNLVLIWVQAADEAEIKHAFERTRAVRKLGPQAKELADMYFFETLVRIHRAGEGAPYTGLKPAGRDLGPAIPAADKALQDGSVEPLVKLLADTVERGVRERFEAANSKKAFNANDVTAGRAYVQTYVPFIHYVEGIYEAAHSPAHGHFPEMHESAAPAEIHGGPAGHAHHP